ncbi:hypothetical protein C7C46_26125 [Streptomyces tateyamensis]|uniref:TIGR04086 family membrane protein n=1 Tax=Streptomyces tateyamensis TaxID=565073 RepID=A0A2V4NJM8_9ACTN|nr:DUF6113 family protein [Streptomyces tateyamensis]PYC72116.1 hypothetical protein C7C46_26125 [Streptomyces tateyamensis]
MNPLHLLLGTRAQRLAEPLPPRRTRGVWYLVFLVLGLLAGVCGSFVQALWDPFGLLLALAGCAAVFYGGLRAAGTKLGAGAGLIGWFVTTIVLAAPRPEGDFVLSSQAASYLYLIGGLTLGVVCASLPTRSPYAFGIPRQRD